MKILFSILFFTISLQTTMAASSISMERKLFTIEKSFNSENVLIINAFVDNNCKFVTKDNNYFDFYWLMNRGMVNRERRQPVHNLIKSSVASRITFIGVNASRDMFQIRLNDLKEINHDLESNIIDVRAEIQNGKCNVESVLKLGASANYKDLSLERTFCTVKTNLVGVPNGCTQLELKGHDFNNDSSNLKVTYQGK